jgi:hypothetical protein
MSATGLAMQLVVAQQHEPPAGAHFLVLGGAAFAALVIFGVRWWRGRRDAAAAPDEQAPSQDRSPEDVQKDDEAPT